MSLDLDKTYLEYDEHDALYGLERQNEQLMQSFAEASQVKVPKTFQKIDQIVFLGLGASALPGSFVESVFGSEVKVPIVRLGAGELPKFISSKTLVVAVSHSGKTEGVLVAVKMAKKKKAKVMVVAGGGKMIAFARKDKLPNFRYSAGDLAVTPALAAGFMLGGVLGLLKSAGVIKVSKAQLRKVVEAVTQVVDSSESQTKAKSNPAKIVAKELKGRPLVVLAGSHLKGSAFAFAHYVEEIGGQSAQTFSITEAGTKTFDFIIESTKPFEVVILKSTLYSKKTREALEQLAKSLEDRGVSLVDYEARGKTELEEAGEVMQFGMFVGYYLALLNKRSV